MNTNIETLQKENDDLKATLKKIREKQVLKKKKRKKFLKLIAFMFAGKNLKTSIYNSIKEFNEQRKISLNTTSNLIASLIKRLTRIGGIALLIAILPTTLMIYQNNLLKKQNKKIQDQTFLSEASRRSGQMFIMGDVFSDINAELNTGKATLSKTLTGRIVSLSRAMKPYKYLASNNELIEKSISPERGQLLITLCKSDLNALYFVDEILQESDFTKSELINASLKNAVLRDVNLFGSNLSGSNLVNTNFKKANLINTNLRNVDFEDANLGQANLQNADLTGAFLTHTRINGANLTNAILDSVKVHRADWFSYITKAKVKGADELNDRYEIDSLYLKGSTKKVLTILEK